MISIAIDGPSGAGKSTLAKRLAKQLGYIYVDTGAMYRAIGLYALQHGIDVKNETAVQATLADICIGLKHEDDGQHVYLNKKDVSDAIREEKVGMAASAVSAHPTVRAYLLEAQRGMAMAADVLMDGRDIGTVVLPDATVKIFLTASSKARAQRRYKELCEKGQTIDFDTVLADIEQRDYNDTHRAAAPLKQAEDAILVDTSDLNFEESFEKLLDLIKTHAK
ncbi:MAG: (d)CMP kinase [Oscillospiraceae bacterium]|nr:(d)CMP kinase [Oscillospiraceae bacterium]